MTAIPGAGTEISEMSAGNDMFDGFHLTGIAASAIVEFVQSDNDILSFEMQTGPLTGFPTPRNAPAGVAVVLGPDGSPRYYVTVCDARG